MLLDRGQFGIELEEVDRGVTVDEGLRHLAHGGADRDHLEGDGAGAELRLEDEGAVEVAESLLEEPLPHRLGHRHHEPAGLDPLDARVSAEILGRVQGRDEDVEILHREENPLGPPPATASPTDFSLPIAEATASGDGAGSSRDAAVSWVKVPMARCW